MSASDPSPPSNQTPAHLPGAVQFDMASKISGRTYRVFVFRPVVPPPPAGYPVMVTSDGNMTFPIAAAMAASFAYSGAPGLVVSVGYPTSNPLELMGLRTRDLTSPTPVENIRPQPGLPPPKAENFGGAAAFLRFLTEELRPAIAAGWPADPDDQTLFGYSLGGLFVLDALFSRPDCFRGFVAASPSIWWNNRAVLEGEAGFLAKVEAKAAAPRVLITIGAEEQAPPKLTPPGMTPEEVKTLVAQALMVDNARALGERLARAKGAPGYLARFHAFEGEDHLTALAASVARALDFALRP